MTRRHSEAGLTLLEVMVVVAILGLGVGIASLRLQPLETPLQSSATLVEGFFREARLKAIATTSAYRVLPSTSSRLMAQTADSCGASTWTTVVGMNLDLASGVTLSSTAWSVCFGSRGISNDNVSVKLLHDPLGSTTIEVLLGGTTRIVE